MVRDTRTYVRINDGMPDNPKILDVGDLAGWLYVCGLCYCSRQLTDGAIPVAMVGRLTGLANYEALASALLEAKLWHALGHDCTRCPQPAPGTYVVHDYLDHQRSAAEVRELSEKRAAAGQKGGRASGVTRRNEANGEASASAKPKQPRSKNEAETDTDTERRKRTTSSSNAPRKRAAGPPETATETDPETAARDKLAREVLAWWWDQLDPKPAGKNAFHASLRVLTNLLAVGHEPKAIAAAARTIGTPLTTARMEIELGRMRTAAASGTNGTGRPAGPAPSRNMQVLAEARARLDAQDAENHRLADTQARTIQGEFSWSPATP